MVKWRSLMQTRCYTMAIHGDRSLTPATGQAKAFFRHVTWIPRFLLGVLQPGVEPLQCTDACYETNHSDDQETAFIWNHS